MTITEHRENVLTGNEDDILDFYFFTCSKTDQFLSQSEELQVKLRILDANILKFGVDVPWFSHHFAAQSHQELNNGDKKICYTSIILDSLIHLD